MRDALASDRELNVAGTLRDAVRQTRVGFWRFAEFDLFFKVAAVILLQPVLAYGARSLISSTGYPALSNEQLLAFFTSLPGIALILFFVGGSLAIIIAEQTGFHLMDLAVRSGREMSAAEALWLSLRRLADFSRLGFVLIMLVCLALLPPLAVGALTYRLLLSGADINYYLSERPPEFWIATAIGLALLGTAVVVASRLYARWLLCVPVVLYERCGPARALRRAAELSRRDRARIRRTALAWMLVVIVAGILVVVLFDLLGLLLTRLLGGHLKLLLPSVGALVLGGVLVVAVVGLVGVTVNSAFVNLLYARLIGDPDLRGSAQQAAIPALGAAARRRWRRANRALRLAAAVMVVGSAVSALIVVRERQLAPPVYVTAHRGSSLRAPENSLSAIEAAIEDGADYAEIDVQETADGVIMVMHDSDLLRIAGRDWKIWETDYDRLRELDAGSWFGPEFAGERIPTLEEVIELARGRIRLNIELKYNGHDQRLAERVVDILETSDFVDQVVISSLELRGIREVREIDPEARVGFIVASSIGNLTRIDADFFSINSRSVSQDLVRRLRRNGKGVHVWTVNGRRNMSTFIDLGVENIITDEPAVLREMLREREELDEAEKVLLAFRNWLRS